MKFYGNIGTLPLTDVSKVAVGRSSSLAPSLTAADSVCVSSVFLSMW